MKNRTTKIIIFLIALFLIGAVFMMQNSDESNSTRTDENSSTQSQNEPNTVYMDNFKFSTQNLTVVKGTTVTWKNKDTAKHDINFADSNLTDSELLDQNKTYSYTFDTIGEYSYSCTPHPFMKATITVTEM